MQVTKFEIKYYRGIKQCEIVLNSNTLRLFPLIGLNESGKSTILEAISCLRIVPKDNAPGNESGSKIPDEHRHVSKIDGESNEKKSTIRIFYRVTPLELEKIRTHPNKPDYDPKEENEDKLETCKATLEDVNNTADHNLIFEKILRFGPKLSNSNDPNPKTYLYDTGENNIIDTKKKESEIPPTPLKMDITDAHDRHWNSSIFYFSQFNFKLPKQIVAPFGHMLDEPFLRYMFEHSDPLDRGYCGYLLDILSEIQPKIFEKKATHLTSYNKLISKIKVTPSFSSEKSISEKFKHYKTLKENVQLTLGNKLTEIIIKPWCEIHSKKTRTKTDMEIVVKMYFHRQKIENRFFTDSPGRKELKLEKERNLYFKLFILENGKIYSIDERSSGFQWYLNFKLCTYHVMKFNSFSANKLRGLKGNIYLFDEPAPSLHPMAQQKILEDFIKLSEHNNLVIYATHNPYLLKKELIENTIVVHNEKEEGIQATFYKNSLGDYPSQRAYFLLLNHILDFIPSSFEMDKPSLIVEGKTDYFFFSLILSKNIQEKVSIIPGTGARTFSPILSILFGWRQKVIVLLDADKEGKKARDNYREEHFKTEEEKVQTLAYFAKNFKNQSIEDVISNFYKEEITRDTEVTKKAIQDYIRNAFHQSQCDSDYKFTIKEDLKPFVKKVEKWINEQLLLE